jgi:hypothetical protein
MTAAEPSYGPDTLVIVRRRPSYPDVIDSIQRMVADRTIRSGTVLELDPAYATKRAGVYEREIADHISQRSTELVILYHFHSTQLPDQRPFIEKLKSLPHRPVVALTNGDAFFNGTFRPAFPRSFLQAATAADVVFSTSMGVTADYLMRRGSKRLALLPHGVCQVRFGGPPPLEMPRPDFKVVFIGSNNRPRNFFHSYHWYARERERLIRKLTARFDSSFAVFGRGWQGLSSWQGPIPFEQQQDVCRRSEVVIGGVPFSPARYYTSDRVFIQTASGVPFVDIGVDGVETLLRDRDHWHLAPSIDKAIERCEELLARPLSERHELGRRAASFVLAQHTVEARFRSLVATLIRVRQALLEGASIPPPNLDYFLPDVDTTAELPLATRGWR